MDIFKIKRAELSWGVVSLLRFMARCNSARYCSSREVAGMDHFQQTRGSQATSERRRTEVTEVDAASSQRATFDLLQLLRKSQRVLQLQTARGRVMTLKPAASSEVLRRGNKRVVCSGAGNEGGGGAHVGAASHKGDRVPDPWTHLTHFGSVLHIHSPNCPPVDLLIGLAH